MTVPEESSLLDDTLLVMDEARAAVVANRRELRRLAPFQRGECTVSQVAHELGLSVTAAFKLTARYQRQGLIWETRREKRPGRDLRYYRAPRAYFVPFSVRPFEQIGAYNRAAGMQQFEQYLSRAMREALPGEWGLLTCCTPSGEPYYEIVSRQGKVFQPDADGSPLILAGWNRVALTRDEARELQRQWVALLEPYFNRAAQGEVYQVGLFMAPET